MTFEELWREVQGLPEMAKIQVPGVLSESTKMKLIADEKGTRRG